MKYRMPAEWQKHKGILMQWPLFWNPGPVSSVRRNFVELATAISRFEPVWMLAASEAADEARKLLAGVAHVLEIEHDDCWVRDNGPIFVRGENGEAAVLDFKFNAWGCKYPYWDNDDIVPAQLCKLWDLKCIHAPLVLEGGNICVNGAGTLITVKECLMNKNRNPGLKQSEIEHLLKENFGVEQVVWLPWGLYGDETDGHVDNVCAFINEDTVLMQWTFDKSNPNFKRQTENLDVLKEAGLKVETILAPPMLYARKAKQVQKELLTASYINFLYVNKGLILPQFGRLAAKADAMALAKMKELFPKREIVPVLTHEILRGGGNIHCVTQQVIEF